MGSCRPGLEFICLQISLAWCIFLNLLSSGKRRTTLDTTYCTILYPNAPGECRVSDITEIEFIFFFISHQKQQERPWFNIAAVVTKLCSGGKYERRMNQFPDRSFELCDAVVPVGLAHFLKMHFMEYMWECISEQFSIACAEIPGHVLAINVGHL